MKKYPIIILSIFTAFLFFSPSKTQCEESQNSLPKYVIVTKEYKYYIRLTNGDEISGYVYELINNPEHGEGLKIQTELGKAEIFASEIAEIHSDSDFYRHNHRLFLLPTADPISSNHFIGDFELLFFYFGFGISDIVSITGGRTIIPGISSKEQVSALDGKITLYNTTFAPYAKSFSLALGGNLTFLNNNNKLSHLYGAGTITFNRSAITASLFVKTGNADFNRLYFGVNAIDMKYANGSWGLALGLDTRFSQRNDLHFIGELWNSNVMSPSNSGVLLGLRLCNTSFSTDFGIAFFTQPFAAPFASFVWTPF